MKSLRFPREHISELLDAHGSRAAGPQEATAAAQNYLRLCEATKPSQNKHSNSHVVNLAGQQKLSTNLSTAFTKYRQKEFDNYDEFAHPFCVAY